MDTTPSSSSSNRLPDWLAEALDVLSARRRLVVATAVGLVLLGAIVSLVAPSILPARAVVGAAVGIAAALLATALALALDASDLVVRGTRHVRAAGGTVDVRVGRQPDDVGPLLAAVARHATNGQVRVALSAASRTAGVPGPRASALAEALARTGRKVLLTDLTRGGTPAAGLSDVITGNRTLAEVVRFEQELYLARLAVGSDPDRAISGFADWANGLPDDLEVLVAALPPLAEPGVLKAAGSMDVTLVLVEIDRTERVDLIASLDAVDTAGLASELVLVDPDRVTIPSFPGATDGAAEDRDSDDAFAEADAVAQTEGQGEDEAGEDQAGEEQPEVATTPPGLTALDTEPSTEGLAGLAAEDAPPPAAAAHATLPDAGAPDQPDQPDQPDEAGEVPTDEPVGADEDAPASDVPVWDREEPEQRDTSDFGGVSVRVIPAPVPTPPLPTPVGEAVTGADEVDEPGDLQPEGLEDADALDDEHALDETVEIAVVGGWDDSPTPEPEPAPAPPAPAPPAPAAPRPQAPAVDEDIDAAAFEVARTSAALQQLAQQIWAREEQR